MIDTDFVLLPKWYLFFDKSAFKELALAVKSDSGTSCLFHNGNFLG